MYEVAVYPLGGTESSHASPGYIQDRRYCMRTTVPLERLRLLLKNEDSILF